MNHVFDTSTRPLGIVNVVLGDCTTLPVKAIGSLELRVYHSCRASSVPAETRVLLTDVYVLEGLQINVFSFCRARKRPNVPLFNGKLGFDNHKRSSSQVASGLPPSYGRTPFVTPVGATTSDTDSSPVPQRKRISEVPLAPA